MQKDSWPDPLSSPEPVAVTHSLGCFWQELATLPDLLHRREHLLTNELIGRLRCIVIDMMLALNGIRRPEESHHLNVYLSDSQRAALEKTLPIGTVGRESWVSAAVALVVIYRWYASQLVDKYRLSYPADLEHNTWSLLYQDIPDWPRTVTTEPV